MEYCGQCRQFSRAAENIKDLCAAWDQPTEAKRAACGFFSAKKPLRPKTAPTVSDSQARGLRRN